MKYPELEIKQTITSVVKTTFPYVPGLLSFREGPVILKCVKKLKLEPDLFIFDGQGLAHPRKAGLATHMGVILNKPSIGSAKSHLYGSYSEPKKKKGDYSIVKDRDGSPIGAVLRTREAVKPVFVSPGHLTDIRSSVKIILACSPKYKIPEPIRAAHRAASLS
jgi:deoxyribonuclease V